MIVAGIDEAGYGPVLGPLVVGASAFELPGDPGVDLPCLWKLLRKFVSKNRTRDGKKLHINDSKLVNSSAGGLKALERGVLALLAASEKLPATLEELLHRVSPQVLPQMARYPWYRLPPDEKFPIEQDALSIQLMANALRADMDRTQTRLVHLAARVVCEAELNTQFEATRNKSSVLFSTAAGHLDDLLRKFGDKGLVVICDRQGGRDRYGPLLRLMFEEWSLEIISEDGARSEYALLRNGHLVRIVFVEKAEVGCLPVALASMLCKYLREAMMGRFNAYWQTVLPEVKPTAGYHGDGNRFIADIDFKRRELGIRDEQLIRSR